MHQAAPNIEDIFFAALQFESLSARSSFLDRACGDPELRLRVERLLTRDAEASGFLESSPAPPTLAFESPGFEEAPGTLIGPYKLMEQIGEGGMGIVYVAEQTQPVRRKVALKIIKPGMDTKQVIARFEAERQALAMMDHPNIAKVHDGGTTESGRPYFVMELVRGLPITEYCDGEQLSIRDRLDLFVLVCRAVQHAHQKGIIHRDLKPSNILVTLHDGVPVPKVIDFGVAKATGQSLTEKTIYTAFTQMLGTPLYMSPEQVELSAMDADTRSDIYSLGVLLYELLTGTTPFDPETLKLAAFDEMRRIIREHEPPKPSMRLSTLGKTLSTVSARRKADPRRLGASLSGELDWVVMKALEKDRRRRYETANDFAADVMNYLAERPVEARPPTAWYRVFKCARRNSVALTTGAIVSLALIAGTVVSTWQAVRATRAEERSSAALREAQTQRRLAERHLLSARLRYAQQAVDSGQTARAREILGEIGRGSDRTGLHEFPYAYLSEVASGSVAPAWPNQQPYESIWANRDGTAFAAFNRDGPIEFLDRATGRILTADPASRPLDRFLHPSWSADGGHFAVVESTTGAGQPRRGWIWDTRTGKRLVELAPLPSEELERVIVLTRGRFLTRSVTRVGKDRQWTFRLWDLGSDSTRPFQVTAFEGASQGVASTRDGERFALRQAGRLVLVDVASGTIHKMLCDKPAHPRPLLGVFSHDGTVLSERQGTAVVLWNTIDGSEFARFELDRVVPWESLFFSPDGHTVVVTDKQTGIATVWDRTRGRTQTIQPSGHPGPFKFYVTFSPTGGLFALFVDQNGTIGPITIWHVASGTQVASCPMPIHPSYFPEFLADERMLLIQGESQCWLWRLDHLPVPGHANQAWSVALSSDGRILASGSDNATRDDSTIKLWDAATGRLLRGWQAGTGTVAALAFSPDGRTLASAALCSSANVRLWNVNDGRLLTTLEGHTDKVRSVAFAPDGKTLASAGSDRTIRLWDVTTGLSLSTLTNHSEVVRGVAFSPDGRRIASVANDRTARLWDVATWRELRTFKASEKLNAIAFAPDGLLLAAADQGGNIHLWDTVTGATHATIPGDRAELFTVAFAPDGRTLAAAGASQVVRIWDVLTGQEQLALPGHRAQINGLTFSPNGRALASCSHDGVVKLWSQGADSKLLSPPLRGSVDVLNSPDLPRSDAPAYSQSAPPGLRKVEIERQ